jgi:sulfur-oxidizing protein SoxZ
MSPAVSKDPLLYFRFRHAKPGERIRVTWVDNRGTRRVDEALIS